jgi:hypothetical protein
MAKWKRKCLSLRGHKQCHRKSHGDMQLSEVAGLTQQKCSMQLNRHLTCHNLHCMAHYDAGSPGTFANSLDNYPRCFCKRVLQDRGGCGAIRYYRWKMRRVQLANHRGRQVQIDLHNMK